MAKTSASGQGDLHGHVADPAGPAVDEDLLLAWTCARSTRPSQAVMTIRGRAAASRMVSEAGLWASRRASTAA